MALMRALPPVLLAGVLASPAFAEPGRCLVTLNGDAFIAGPCEIHHVGAGKLHLVSASKYLLLALHPSPERDGTSEAVAARVRIDETFATYPAGHPGAPGRMPHGH